MKSFRGTTSKRRILPVFLLVTALAFIGTTIAFYSEGTIFNNLFHLGEDVSVFEEEFIPDDNWVPCAEVDKIATATNKNSTPRYVRMKLDEYWRLKNSTLSEDNHTDTDLPLTWTDENDNTEHYAIINFQNEDDWDLSEDGWYYYKEPLEENETTNSLLKSVTLNCKANMVGEIVYSNDGQTGNSVPSQYADAKYHLHVTFEMSDEDFVAEEHTITINPNGGSYAGSTETTTVSAKHGRTFTLDTPVLTGYSVDYWEVVSGDVGEYATDGRLNSDSFKVNEDITLIAHWTQAVARIERTQKTYPSIMKAENAAQAGDTITLLVDTAETVTNSKNVTLDLNEHIVTGSLTNNAGGNITLINGEINNPEGAAVTNNGSLTMGINDFKEDESVNILRTNIRLIGTDTGLKQNGEFYFYDGFIEGDVGLEGGYNGAPYYRNTFDGVVVYYFPLVEHNNEKDCQHVELASADGAVSKTTVNGDIYYYNLQDNINTSARTGYQIYAVRDFSATYPITVAANTEIKLDTVGYDILFSDTITNNGTFEIKDSNSTVNSETSAVTYDSNNTTPQTIINRGNLKLINTRLTGTTSNDTIKNYGTLTMRGGTLGATTGYVFQPISGATYDLDSTSYIRSTSSNTAIYNGLSGFTWDTDGNIIASGTAISSHDSGTVILNRGYIRGDSVGIASNSITINGGTVSSSLTGIQGNPITINGGKIAVSGGSWSYHYPTAVSGAPTMNDGEITVSCTGNYQCYGIKTSGGTMNIRGGSINVSAESGSAYGIHHDYQNWNTTVTNIYGGTITVKNNNGTSYGIYSGYYGDYSQKYLYIYGGTITATAKNTGYGVNAEFSTITGGAIYGNTYGVYSRNTAHSTNIGSNDSTINTASPEIIGGSYGLYGGSINFYDGILRGNTNAYQAGVIKAIPDATKLNIEASDDYVENCWLVESENYLQVGDEQFNSLTKAYNAITGDTGTIQVIADATVEAVLPGSPANKTITFDLNGHKLTYTQALTNNSIMTITDSSEEKTGKFLNTNGNGTAIINKKELTIESGYISSAYRTISQNAGAKLTINGGTINSSGTAIHAENYSDSNPITITINNGLISANQQGIYSYGSNIYLYGGKVKVSGSSSATGIAGANITIDTGNENVAVDASTSGQAGVTGVQGTITLKSGIVQISHPAYYNYESYGISGTINMTGGKVIATGGNYRLFAVNGSGSINGGEISVNAGGYSCGVKTSRERGITMNGGTVSVASTNSANGVCVGDYYSSFTLNGGTITANSSNSDARGIVVERYDKNYVYINNGTITANSTSANGYGFYGEWANITGGKIYGSTYGFYTEGYYNNTITTIGSNDGTIHIDKPEIIGGQYGVYGGDDKAIVYFYDGILRGNTNAYKAGIIKAIPDATELNIESSNDYAENCWLIESENYLQVGETEYNSLKKAYDAITEDSGVIKVIASTTVEAVLPGSPAGKTITFDLNGHQLTYTQTLTNNSTMTIIDSSNEKTGRLINPNPQKATIQNNGTLVVDSAYISSAYRAINQSANTSLTINGNTTISSSDTGINNESGTSTITVNNGLISAGRIGISANNDVTINQNGGKIKVTGPSGSSGISGGKTIIDVGDDNVAIELQNNSGNRSLTGISGGSVNLKSGTVQVSHPDWCDYNVEIVGISSTFTLNGGKLIVTANSACKSFGTEGTSTVVVNSGLISVTSGTAWGIYSRNYGMMNDSGGTSTINGGAIVVESLSGSATGIHNGYRGNTTISGGSITARGAGTIYGIYSYKDSGTNTNVNGGTITATSTTGTAYGVYADWANIRGGTINSQNYGFYSTGDTNGARTYIGSNDGTLHTDYPDITGGDYALYGANTYSAINFYDGILRGGISSYQDGLIKTVADNSTFYITTQIIGEGDDAKEYDTRYLIEEYDVAKIGDTKYTKLSDAITAAEENDLIELIADNYIFSTITIPAEKSFTIETNGFNIITGNPITNNGNVTIKNSQYAALNPTFKYRGTSYFITNNADASLSLQNLSLESNNILLNKGTMSLDNSKIIANETAINNQKHLTVTNNITTTGWSNAIYNSGETASFSGGVVNGNVQVPSGELSLLNTTVQKSGSNIFNLVINNSTLNLSNTTIALTNDGVSNRDADHPRAVYNSGTFTAENNSIIKHIATGKISEYIHAIYNDNLVTIKNSSVILDNSAATYNEYDAYGIYSPSSKAIVESGNIQTSSKRNSYALYTNSGEIILGVAEDPSSQNYGLATADVSTTSPAILGVGTTSGYGVYYNTGKVRFYDGRVSGNTNSFSKAPTNTEYLYEAHTYTDENTGYPYTILEWIREQP